MKRFLICAANFIIPGLGYIFIPSRKLFGWILVFGTLIVMAVQISANSIGMHTILTQLQLDGYTHMYAVSYLGYFIMRAAFAYDAYKELKGK